MEGGDIHAAHPKARDYRCSRPNIDADDQTSNKVYIQQRNPLGVHLDI